MTMCVAVAGGVKERHTHLPEPDLCYLKGPLAAGAPLRRRQRQRAQATLGLGDTGRVLRPDVGRNTTTRPLGRRGKPGIEQ